MKGMADVGGHGITIFCRINSVRIIRSVCFFSLL
jgi:hypothetical protein